MAVLRKKVLGEIVGKVGEFVGKVRNGNHYISSVPSHYTPSQEQHEIDKRSRFTVNSKFGKAVNDTRILYRIWDSEKAPTQSAFNKFCKVNFELCGTDRPTGQNVITPPGGFSLKAAEINALPDGIEIIPEPFDTLSKEDGIIFILIASLYEPRIRKKKYFEFLEMQDCETDETRLIFRYDQKEKKIAGLYKHMTVFLAAVTVDKNGNIVRWSKTAAAEL